MARKFCRTVTQRNAIWKNNKINKQSKTKTNNSNNKKNLTSCCFQCETFAEREGEVSAEFFWSPSDPFLSLCRSPPLL